MVFLLYFNLIALSPKLTLATVTHTHTYVHTHTHTYTKYRQSIIIVIDTIL